MTLHVLTLVPLLHTKLTQPRLVSVERVQVTAVLEACRLTLAAREERALEVLDEDDSGLVKIGRARTELTRALVVTLELLELEELLITDATDEVGSERVASADDVAEELLTGKRMGVSG
jgi:hypothetical protein